MDRGTLYDTLRKINEPKGFFINKDRQWVDDLLDALLRNKDRYVYMACPCRLAANDRRKDSDIICPCAYRQPDIDEYGCCYCRLYVSRGFNESAGPPPFVPERRPPEKFF
ncbi:MAG: Ferredoxin thioredoxin reductase catalytic beta chain [Syntrophus sp. PtaU1.Bin208]|nr:MAG: Ferredoxin thioredoxin reductase catalytic beta chain [Syntrophus sp. PtaU1.Bin208]